jgi:uncharacterized protein YjbI with pentapeptide repeats
MVDFKPADFSGQDLQNANFAKQSLPMANFIKANLTGANFKSANLTGADFSGAILIDADFSDANLNGACFEEADLSEANLTNVDFDEADLSGADLSEVNLQGVKGLGSKEKEMLFAKDLLSILESGEGTLCMFSWHTCNTAHCIAGWYAPKEEYPGATASRALPTLAKYFFSSNEEALAALRRVASGEESVWNNTQEINNIYMGRS